MHALDCVLPVYQLHLPPYLIQFKPFHVALAINRKYPTHCGQRGNLQALRVSYRP